MDEKKRITALMLLAIATCIAIVLYQKIVFSDGKLHIVFCDVGQGDAIFIRTPGGTDILVDGGPDRRVLDCLGRHMPFWDRTVEMVFLTHPHADHLNGLVDVIERYSILHFSTERLRNETAGFETLTSLLKSKGVTPRHLFSGERIRIKDGVSVRILGPTSGFLAATSPQGTIGGGDEFASLVMHFSFGEFDLLLTGDSQAAGLDDAGVGPVEVLQVPHHGSKTGLTATLVERLQPRLAVISVGKDNRYGHPNPGIVKILEDEDIRIVRTDEHGEIEIISDGEVWNVQTNRLLTK